MTTLRLDKLTEFRENRLMSRTELARKAEVSPQTILKIESGKKCRPETARRIIIALGYAPEDIKNVAQEIIGSGGDDK
jgi:DNA-binding XRE family transcriptional regulator